MQAMLERRRLIVQLKLTVNEDKTDIRQLPEERFDFQGYSFGRYYSSKAGRAYLCPQPSKRSIQRMIGKVREATERNVLWLSAEELVKRVNSMLIGWANYSSLGPVHKAYRTIDHYTSPRLRRWLCNKHKVRNTGARCFSYEYLHGTLGLVQLQLTARRLPSTKA